MDRLFNKVFKTMDESQALQKVGGIIGLEGQTPNKQQGDRSICSFHRIKKTLYCEQCMYDMCSHCKDRHDKSHPVKFVEESARQVIEKFMESLEALNDRKKVV